MLTHLHGNAYMLRAKPVITAGSIIGKRTSQAIC